MSNLLEHINAQFNRELEWQISGALPHGHIYQLGMPSDVLLSADIPHLQIELAASRLGDKSMQAEHPFDLLEMKNLPMAIQKPMAVFRSATHVGSFVVMTEIEHNDKNFVAALQVNKSKGRIQINDIRSIHYRRSNVHIANWINLGLLNYADHKRMQQWLSKQRYNSAEVRKPFEDAAKVVISFRNSKFKVEKIQKVVPSAALQKILDAPSILDNGEDSPQIKRRNRGLSL